MSAPLEGHAPDCTCGCHDHAHDHGHDHDHGHGHAGDHDHGHGHDHAHGHDHHDARTRMLNLAWADVTLESHVHDQASTVSATICAKRGSGRTFDVLVEALQAVAVQVESAGAIIGHIKAYARTADSFAHASATDAQHAPTCEGDARLPLGPDAQCQLAAIVLLIDLEELEQVVAGVLEAL